MSYGTGSGGGYGSGSGQGSGFKGGGGTMAGGGGATGSWGNGGGTSSAGAGSLGLSLGPVGNFLQWLINPFDWSNPFDPASPNNPYGDGTGNSGAVASTTSDITGLLLKIAIVGVLVLVIFHFVEKAA